ncbi:hypothetical protein ABPG75_001901 [Micractinium tetrahymenae]
MQQAANAAALFLSPPPAPAVPGPLQPPAAPMAAPLLSMALPSPPAGMLALDGDDAIAALFEEACASSTLPSPLPPTTESTAPPAALPAELLRGTSEDLFLQGLLQLDSTGSELSPGFLERIFAGREGDELLGVQFAGLTSPAAGESVTPASAPAAAPPVAPLAPALPELHQGDPAALAAEVAAARSLLASLDASDSAAAAGLSPLQPAASTAGTAHQPSEQTALAPLALPVDQQMAQAAQGHSQVAAYQAAQHMPCAYLDLSTGRILHAAPAAHVQPFGMALLQAAPLSVFPAAQAAGSVLGGHTSMGPAAAASAAAAAPRPSTRGSKRRRTPAVGSSHAQEGSREPLVAHSLFEPHAAQPFPSAGPPSQQAHVLVVPAPAGMLGLRLHAVQSLPVLPVPAAAQAQAQAQPSSASSAGPQQGAASKPVVRTASRPAPGGVLAGVQRELQSVASEPPPATDASAAGGGLLRGVRRDLNSLTWEALLEVPPAAPAERRDSGFLDGFKQDLLRLGKFSTCEAAGRAVDLASLALGLGTQNFPEASYSKALPTLAAHPPDQVVAVIQKDAQLALARGSKYRGVRRVGGPGRDALFEARLPPPRGSGEAAAAGSQGALAVPADLAAPGLLLQPVQLPLPAEAAALALHEVEAGLPAEWQQQQQWLLGGAQPMALDQQLAAAAMVAAAAAAEPRQQEQQAA